MFNTTATNPIGANVGAPVDVHVQNAGTGAITKGQVVQFDVAGALTGTVQTWKQGAAEYPLGRVSANTDATGESLYAVALEDIPAGGMGMVRARGEIEDFATTGTAITANATLVANAASQLIVSSGAADDATFNVLGIGRSANRALFDGLNKFGVYFNAS